jgi:DNA polymerase-4
MILHVDMDAFFASIEQAINPRLKGKPVIVGSRPNKLYTVVCAASYEAKALGIDSGMPTKEAFRLCPGLEFVAADQSKYIWTSQRIFEILKSYNLELIYASIDEFRMDIGKHPNPQILAQDIQRQIYANFNITASIGIAKNCLLAKLASKLNKPNGIAILNEANLLRVLSQVPVEKLCGIGKSSQETLNNLGLKTCLDLYQKSPSFLEQIFGQNGLNLYASLHLSETLTGCGEPEKPKSIGHSYTLPRASETPQFIQSWIRLLSEMVGQRLRQGNLTANTVHLWLNGPKIGNFNQQRTFQQAINDGFEIYRRCLKIMAKIGPKMPKIRAIGITCSSLKPGSLGSLFSEENRREELMKTLDKINGRFGEGSIYPAAITLTKKMF